MNFAIAMTAGAAGRRINTKSDAPATETIAITGLTNGTTYVVQARARNSAGAGEWSGSSEGATPISTVPTEPNGFVLSVDMQTITATWTAPTDTGDSVITHYELQHREVGTSAWEPVIATADADTLTLLIPNLTKGAEYEVQVYAVNTDGNGNPTEIKKITIPATVPSAPNAPTLTGGNTELVVAWTVPNNGGSPITSYKVQYSSDGGTNWTPAPGNPISATSYTIPSLMNGTTYDVQVRAVNTVGDGGWSVSATLTLPTKPAALTAPTLAGGNARLVVEWTAPDDGGSAITEYKVQYSSDGESTWTAVTDTIHGTTTSSTITGLTNGTSYVVQVRAANMQGDGDWSASATAMLPVPVFATQVPSGTAASVVLSTAIDTQIVTENLTVSLAPVTSAASTVTLPTVTASTGLITVTATTTAGTYVVSGADGGGIERFSEHFHVTVSPADNAALDTQVTAGITAWGNTADLNYIVTAAVTNMSEVFKDASTFNGDISDWDVSKVTDMSDMFRGANVFNQNISGWTVSSVTDMSGMFRDAHAFNQDLTNWTVSSVTNMNNMFIYARTFNGDISNWDTGAVTTMAQMFNGASVFNNDISGWNVSKVENMYWMFYQASGFSQNLNDWAWNNSVSPAVPWKTSDGGKWNNGTYIGVKGAMFTGSGVTGDLIPSWY